MPYTKEELQKNEFWQRLHEQDRADYQNKLQHAVDLQGSIEVFDNKLGKIPLEQIQPLRNEAGTFLAFEDPDTGMNFERPDQVITIDKKSAQYHSGEIKNKVLETEIKELV